MQIAAFLLERIAVATATDDSTREVYSMKKIAVRKAGSVRLTSSAAYWPPCWAS
jgi:hypothetical protein